MLAKDRSYCLINADKAIGLKTRWPIIQNPPSVLHGGFSEIELKFS